MPWSLALVFPPDGERFIVNGAIDLAYADVLRPITALLRKLTAITDWRIFQRARK